ncbi:hypothetical protein PRK78_004736 [Emydomyces testavorans]|uniref:Aminoglycoside phosphotransferase domain-containing protein n=1 Tax=Emydomyces testavorans TaxID=2070801 RepID=A0AAF0DIK6_9EURO|nr:hypothetical protein PRK78_004736 [Emydomyces testavorans]
MGTLITEQDLDSATWIVGERGDIYGVYITKSGIVVKYGRHVRAQREAMTINFIRETCPQIPVPQVLGAWEEGKGDDTVGYLAMSRMPGVMLSQKWPHLTEPQREHILKDLEQILQQLREIHAPPATWIGAIDGGPAADVRARHAEFGGPFRTESDFGEWLISLIHPESMQYRGPFYIDTLRNCLKKYNHQLRFAHGDLGPHNILVSEEGRVSAIIDWEFAGWYPEYWEYIKMIQFSRDPVFRCFARDCWKDDVGNQVLYDEEFVIDQMLDSQVKHGERVIKRPR